MEVFLKILLMAGIGGLIGYTTNVLAVKMLFKPIMPIKIPMTSFYIQGLIPKRREEIAINLAKAINDELIDYEKIVDSMIVDDDKMEAKSYIFQRIDNIMQEKINFIPAMFRGMIADPVREIIDNELDGIMDYAIDMFKEKSMSRIDLESMISEKINEFDLLELENLIINISKKELKHIEILGLFLGVFIGIFQGIVSAFVL